MELEKAMGYANVIVVMMVKTVNDVQIIILLYLRMTLLLVKNAINHVKTAVQTLDQEVIYEINRYIGRVSLIWKISSLPVSDVRRLDFIFKTLFKII